MSKDMSAGASGEATYQGRLARHQAALRRRRPRLIAFAVVLSLIGAGLLNVHQVVDVPPTFGLYATLGAWLVIVLAVSAAIAAFATPSHITAWGTGAEGERRSARLLEPLESEGFRVLHDRLIPGARSANIDHVVIGPPGVYVMETKSAAGRLRVRGGTIYVQGRRKSDWVDEVRREAQAVQVTLGGDVTVTPIICVHRAEMPFFGVSVDDIPIVSGRDLVRRLRKAKRVLGAEEVARLAALADERLTPAVQTASSTHVALPQPTEATE